MESLYLWVKAFHIIAVISWMAGLLYLPRLFVYHCDCGENIDKSDTFIIMERRLLKAIMTPAMVISWILGLILLFGYQSISLNADGWFHAKLVLVIVLSLFHMFMAKCFRQFSQNQNPHSAKFYRQVNEVPTVVMIAVVILVIVRPF